MVIAYKRRAKKTAQNKNRMCSFRTYALIGGKKSKLREKKDKRKEVERGKQPRKEASIRRQNHVETGRQEQCGDSFDFNRYFRSSF